MPITVRIEKSLFSKAFVARVLDGYRTGELIGYGREAGFPEHMPQLFSSVEMAKSWLLDTGFVIEAECLQTTQRYSRLRHCVHCNKILSGHS